MPGATKPRGPRDSATVGRSAAPAGCAFCAIVAGAAPAHVVVQSESSIAFLDARPLFEGHVLVIPRAHFEVLSDLPADQVGPLFAMARRLSVAVESVLGAEGSFLAINNRVSQSVPHLHVHVVPRRRGDGLRGFFWPRRNYASDEEMAAIAARLRSFHDAPSDRDR